MVRESGKLENGIRNQNLITMAENRYVSDIKKVENSEENLYKFLSDFRNYEKLLPEDKISNFQATEDSCSFDMEMIGNAGLRIVEKEPNKLVKIAGDQNEQREFFLWVQLKQVADKDTRVKITMQVDLPPMMKMMASGPLKEFVNTMASQVVKLDYV